MIVKPSSLGDIIHALPVLNGLRRRYPEARIDWLIGASFAPLLERHPHVSRLVLFDRRFYGRMLTDPRAVIGFVRFLRALRRSRYELVIDLQGLFRSGFITRATGAPVRLGFRDAREGAHAAYTHYLPDTSPDTHAVDRNYTVARVLGFADVPVAFPLPISEDARQRAARWLDAPVANGASGQACDAAPTASTVVPPGDSRDLRRQDRPLVLLAPGARWETKRWPIERFADVIDALTRADMRCVLVGGREDEARCAAIVQRCRSTPLNLAGRTTLPELVALVERATQVICHDSAVAHIAAALERRVICITGPTNPARTGPYRSGCIVRLPLDCSPCYLRRLTQCPHGHRCMTELTAERVLDAVNDAPVPTGTIRV